MTNNEALVLIPGRLHSVATEGHVSGADEIFDDAKGKLQSVINSETDSSLTSLSNNKADKNVTVTDVKLASGKIQKVINGTTTDVVGVATTSENGLMSSDDKSKLNGIASGAEANVQSDWNATSGDAVILNKPTIPAAASDGTYSVKTLVGSTTTIVSDFTANQSSADDVTFVQGSNITLTPDSTNRKITIAGTADTTYTIDTGDSNGQVKVTPSSGSAYNVNVKGLGSNAYSSTSYLPLAGGTMIGDIAMSGNSITGLGGINFNNASGVTIDQYGNIKHKTTTSGSYWGVYKSNGDPIIAATTDGKFGVGTTSPKTTLQVSQGGNTKNYVLTLKNGYHGSDSGNNAGAGVKFELGANSESNKWMGIMATATHGGWENYINMDFVSNNSNDSEPVTVMTLAYSRNVGIGTGNPQYKLHVTGDVGATAFTNTSDIRNKDFVSNLTMNIEQIASAPSFLFKWKTGDDKNVHAGSSAQYWNTVLPEVVTAANDEQHTLSMQYDVIALLSSITIAKELVDTKEKIHQLEERVKELESKLAK